jgi:hypothetical protein
MGFLDNKIGPRFEVKKRPKVTIVWGLFYPIFGPKKGCTWGVVATELAFLAQIHTMSVVKRDFWRKWPRSGPGLIAHPFYSMQFHGKFAWIMRLIQNGEKRRIALLTTARQKNWQTTHYLLVKMADAGKPIWFRVGWLIRCTPTPVMVSVAQVGCKHRAATRNRRAMPRNSGAASCK